MEVTNPLVSVLMPAYKMKYLESAIRSVLKQTYKNFELIIVNDKSPDDIDSIVYGFKDDRIRYYINETNIGGHDPVANWNKCLGYAKGDFVCLLCDDDTYEPRFIERMVSLADSQPETNTFRARAKVIDKDGNVKHLYSTVAKHVEYEDMMCHFLQGCLETTISEWFFRRNRMLECGGYYPAPLAWFSDELSTFRFAQKGGLGYCEEILVSFRCSGENISDSGYKHAMVWLEALNVFEDEMRKLISVSKLEWQGQLLELLQIKLTQHKLFCVSFISFFQTLNVLCHKKKYRLSNREIADIIYNLPRNMFIRLKRKK